MACHVYLINRQDWCPPTLKLWRALILQAQLNLLHGSPLVALAKNGADERNRTFKGLLPLVPKTSASTNFATSANSKIYLRLCKI